MPSEFASELVQRLCEFFSISQIENGFDKTVEHLDKSLRYLTGQTQDELEPLLYIECQSESVTNKLNHADLRRIISRVQRRLTRKAKRFVQTTPKDQESLGDRGFVDFEGIVTQFLQSLRDHQKLELMMVFELYFMEGKSVGEITSLLAISKSKAYAILNDLQQHFREFMDDTGI